MEASEDVRKVTSGDTPVTAALFIGSMAEELSQIAKRHGFEALGYILDMARLEADQIAKSSEPTSRCA